MPLKDKVKKYVHSHKRVNRFAKWLWEKTGWVWLLNYWISFKGIDLPMVAAEMPKLDFEAMSEVQPVDKGITINALFADGREVTIDNAYVKSVDMDEEGCIVCYGWR